MEDFEYSVEICDRDWQCFFVECEECNLLPASLAGVDDSGMSDLDDTNLMFAKRVHKPDLTAGFSEADHPIYGHLDRESPPVEHYPSKYHGASGGGMESVLSGSEEDLHLQSVNIFFERLKSFTEAERPAELSQERGGNIGETKESADGQQASSSSLPENAPKLNSLPARGETAFGKETMKPVDTIGKINTAKKAKPGFSICLQPAASNSAIRTNRLAYPETELFIGEEACTENRVKSQFRDSQEKVCCTEITPYIDKVMKVNACTPLDGAVQKDLSKSQLMFSQKCSTDSLKNLEITAPNVLQPGAASSNQTATQESSPSASVKRKRKKKRRLGTEPLESGFGCERQVSGRPRTNDSEEEQPTWRAGAGVCVPEDVNSPQNNEASSPHLVPRNLPARMSTKEKEVNVHAVPDSPWDSRYQHVSEGMVRLGRCRATGLTAVHSAKRSQSATPLSQSDDWPPRSVAASAAAESEMPGGSGNAERNYTQAQSLQPSPIVSHVNVGCGPTQTLSCCTAEVESITRSILPRADSNGPDVAIGQSDRISVAKSALAAEGHVKGESEQQQQLETDTDRYSSTQGPTPLTETTRADSHNGECRPFKTSTSPFSEGSAELTEGVRTSSFDKSRLAVNQTERPVEVPTLDSIPHISKCDNLPGKTGAAAGQLEQSQSTDLCPSGETDATGSRHGETKLPVSEDLLSSASDVTPLSSCLTLDTESVTSLSNENITDVSASFSSISQNESEGQGERKSLIIDMPAGTGATCDPKSQSVFDLVRGAEDAVTTKPMSMSSFWIEMEKLTINDILGLRMAPSHGFLSPLQENEEADMLTASDSGVFTQLDESKLEQSAGCMLSVPDPVQSGFGSAKALDSSSSRSVMWQSEPVPVRAAAGVYPETMTLTSASDICQPAFPASTRKCLRKISKNISVHNLHALESKCFSSTVKHEMPPALDEGALGQVQYFTEEHEPGSDMDGNSSPPSLTDGYRTSFVDVLQYFFGGKHSILSQSATDNFTPWPIDGNTIPETYDYFFSDFDTESFFCPLFTAEEQATEELVPIFSCSRSANRNLQFPEAYDYFFPSSSSDDSSVESEDEDGSCPMRVVTRFTQKTSTSPISVDGYENFFTDKGLGQNLFWKDTLSFRNFNLTGSTVQKQPLTNTLPVWHKDPSLRRTFYPSNVLGSRDVVRPDPLLCHIEDRISKQLAQQPFRYEDLQMAVSHPRLDASFLPLRQTDMCLVCIAFASWVLKTANPQAGDAWKAVVLANVSALSAIRYLRKYVKVEAAASEKKLKNDVPSNS